MAFHFRFIKAFILPTRYLQDAPLQEHLLHGLISLILIPNFDLFANLACVQVVFTFIRHF